MLYKVARNNSEFVNRLLEAVSDEELQKIVDTNGHLLFPELIEEIDKIISLETDVTSKRKLVRLSNFLFPFVCQSVVIEWISTRDYDKMVAIASDRIEYLADSSVNFFWRNWRKNTISFDSPVSFFQAEQIIQRRLVPTLFSIKGSDQIIKYCKRYQFFLGEPGSIKYSPYRGNMLPTLHHAYALGAWGQCIARTDYDREEIFNAAIYCIDKALAGDLRSSDSYYWAMLNHEKGEFYRLLKKEAGVADLEKAITYYKKALEVLSKELYRREWALTKHALGCAHRKIANNRMSDLLEIAIEYFEEAYEIFVENKEEYDFDNLRNEMGIAYADRIEGDKGVNLLMAVAAFRDSLNGALKKEDREAVCMAQHNLGWAYSQPEIKGDSLNNTKESISWFGAALNHKFKNGYPFDEPRCFGRLLEMMDKLEIGLGKAGLSPGDAEILFPDVNEELMARIFYHVGNEIVNRSEGDQQFHIIKAIMWLDKAIEFLEGPDLKKLRLDCMMVKGTALLLKKTGDLGENINQALECLLECKEIAATIASVDDHSSIHFNLGLAYGSLRSGDRTYNIELGLTYLHGAERDLSPGKDSINFVRLYQSLGAMYLERKIGNEEENERNAIQYLEKCLTILSKDRWPIDWAKAKANLGSVYSDMGTNDILILKKSEQAFMDALSVFGAKGFDYDISLVHNNLGNTYRKLARITDDVSWLHKSIESYELALSGWSKDTYYHDWIRTKTNMILSYDRLLAKGDESFMKKIIEALDEIFWNISPVLYPDYCITTGTILGAILAKKEVGDTKKLIVVYEKVYDAVKSLVNNSIIKTSKEQLKTRYYRFFFILGNLYIKNENYEKAFEVVNFAKAGNIAGALQEQPRDLYKIKMENPEFETLWKKIAGIESRIEQIRSDFRKNTEDALEAIEIEVDVLNGERKQLKEQLAYKFPDIFGYYFIPSVDKTVTMKLARERNLTIIDFFYHVDNISVFVITGSSFNCVTLPAGSACIDEILDMVLNYEADAPSALGLIRQKRIFTDFYENVIFPLKEWLPSNGNLVICPHYHMHNIPFWLAQSPGGQFLFEEFEVYMIGSISTAIALDKRLSLRGNGYDDKKAKVLIISHEGLEPMKLHFSKEEIIAVSKSFPTHVLLSGEEADPDGVIEKADNDVYDSVHFSCHGGFTEKYPDLSGLELKSLLTSARIAAELKLLDFPLVVLSACQSGRLKLDGTDEVNSILQAFLQAGAGKIIGSLWMVNDKATSLLFKRFYEERNFSKQGEFIALRKAMNSIAFTPDYKSAYFWGGFFLYGLPSKNGK